MSNNTKKEIGKISYESNIFPFKNIKLSNSKIHDSSSNNESKNTSLISHSKLTNPNKIVKLNKLPFLSYKMIDERRKSGFIAVDLKCINKNQQEPIDNIYNKRKNSFRIEKLDHFAVKKKYLNITDIKNNEYSQIQINENTGKKFSIKYNDISIKEYKDLSCNHNEYTNNLEIEKDLKMKKSYRGKILPDLSEHLKQGLKNNNKVFETILSKDSNTSEEISNEMNGKVLQEILSKNGKIGEKIKENMRRSIISKSPSLLDESKFEKRFNFYQPIKNNYSLLRNKLPSFKRSVNFFKKEFSQEPSLKNIKELSMSYNFINKMNDSFDRKIPNSNLENSRKLKEMIKLSNKIVMNVKKMDENRGNLINDILHISVLSNQE